MKNFLTKCALRKSMVLISQSSGLHYENIASQLEKTRLALLVLDGVSIAEIEKFEELILAKSKEYEELKKDVLKIKESVKLGYAELESLREQIEAIEA